MGLGAAAVLAGLVLAPAGSGAQETGRITGTVIVESTARPVPGAQVFIPGAGIGGLTNDAGRYLLLGVPAGQVTVRVQLVGHRTAERSVSVEAGGAANLDFQLTESAIALDEVVVTGGGVATERRKLGNTVASIGTETLVNAPITNVSEVLQGREPGVVGMPSSGLAGEGARIRIRGSASLSQSNEPLVYIDGVRADNGGGFGDGVSAGGGGAPSRLDDLDPASIERIEILKGAAAATLYGTEASNGVIQIFTKRGSEGAPRWSVQLEQGMTQAPTNRMIPLADFARDQQDVDRIREFWGLSVQPYEVFQRDVLPEFFETGSSSTASVSVSGGANLINYFVSGRLAREDGAFGHEALGPARDFNQRAQGTANLDVFPMDNLRFRVSSFYSEIHHEAPNNNNNIYAPFEMGFISKPRLAHANNITGVPSFATINEAMQVTTEQDVSHYAGSLGVNFRPVESLSLDATFGVDAVNQRSFEFTPFGWNVNSFTTSNVEGNRNISDRNHRELTADFKLLYDRQLTDQISTSTVLGTQGFLSQTTTSGGSGTRFPGPGLEVAEAGADQELRETWLRVVNAGLFFQEQVGLWDYVFATVGGRYDYNSAFGESAGGAFYPKASLSVIPSDMPAWTSSLVSTLRLRAAVGRSGLQPGAFDQFTTYSPLASMEGPGIEPSNLGNPNLKPEVSTEWEVGAELGLLEDRAALEVTYWDRSVQDALVARQFPVSGGFRNTQLDNIGELRAQGVEIGLNGSLVSLPNAQINVFVNGAYMREEIVSMGGAPPLKVGGSYPRYRNFLMEGYSPGSFFGAKLADMAIPLDLTRNCVEPTRQEALAFLSQPRSPDELEVIPVNCGGNFLEEYIGKPTPDWQGAFGGTGRFFGNFEVSTMFEYKAGNFFVQDLSGAFRRANGVIGRNTPLAAQVESTLLNPASTAEQRLDAAQTWARDLRTLAPMSGLNNIHPADFIRWREASLTYTVPAALAGRLSLDNLSISLSGRNLGLWVNSEYPGLDPEINQVGRCDAREGSSSDALTCNFLSSVEAWGVPLPRRYALAMRFGF